MATGGVAADKDLILAAAVLPDVPIGPGEGAGDVLDVLGMLNVRGQPVVRHDRPNTVPSEERTQGAVDAEPTLVATTPGAAVDKQDDREVFLAPGQEEVELVLHRMGTGS